MISWSFSASAFVFFSILDDKIRKGFKGPVGDSADIFVDF